ncbi:RRP15-like protein [Cucumis melo var. makuwa]|uniref:RRP15-like protein n=1 Tax=Cucumis melo var. makuwa TaxID=1194695 RepID=A0A5D3BX18_CUCMM|nr:RRP15-like protein [Cucumis melo var. makuwa]
MTDVGNAIELVRGAKRRKKMGSRNKKRPRIMGGSGNKAKVDKKMKKLFQKRAREYNSDDDGNDGEKAPTVKNESKILVHSHEEEVGDEELSEGEEERKDVNADVELSEDDENGEIQPGITKFTEGCRAFRAAFISILKKNISDETLGPILSANKKLVAEKLAEEEAERKVKGEARKAKQLVGEKGHVKPATYLDSHEKFLIGVATKGVVKLFNAVNKAQHAQKGLNPSRTKDAKAINKRRKEAFFSELGKPTLSATNSNAKLNTSGGAADAEGPAWAPLRDNYMLTNSKLKDWDKMPDNMMTAAEDNGRVLEDSSSDEDD